MFVLHHGLVDRRDSSRPQPLGEEALPQVPAPPVGVGVVFGTVDAAGGDFRLGAGSPCIDAAGNTQLAFFSFSDLRNRARFIDRPGTPNSGVGTSPLADMGAFEQQADDCTIDRDGSGNVDVEDLFDYLDKWFAQNGLPCG